MAKIKFIPVCSACGARINGTVDYKSVELLGALNEIRIFNDYVITPAHCSSCGEPFEMIEMYTRLPYGGESE
jgi:predicted RNA-binding Zn-ribbon protein involved in translation (DUF1610 family)